MAEGHHGSYYVTIQSYNPDFVINNARLPEEFTLRFESEWEALFGGMPHILEGIDTFNKGINQRTSWSTRFRGQTWQGSHPISMSLKFELIATNDPITDVITPIKLLASLALPTDDGLAGMQIPGPSFAQAFGAYSAWGPSRDVQNALQQNDVLQGNQVSITLGKCMTFNNVIVTEVSPVIKGRLINGYPAAADVDITFRSYFSAATNDLQLMMPAGEDVVQMRLQNTPSNAQNSRGSGH
jgi:hypothetical protein